jgi:hypothetical protein
MIATLDRLTDSDIPVPDGSSAAELRAYYADWRSELGKFTGGEQEVSNCSAVVGKGSRGGAGTVVGVDAGGRAASTSTDALSGLRRTGDFRIAQPYIQSASVQVILQFHGRLAVIRPAPLR